MRTSSRSAATPLLPALADFVERRCDQHYFVTLTDHRNLPPDQFSRDVGWALHKTNEALFGNAYRRRRIVHLATFTVQETTFKDGLHTHLILGVPTGALALKANAACRGAGEILIEAWTKIAPVFRRKQAQDWRPVTDLSGAFGYLQKTIRSAADIDPVDLGNTTFPTDYAAPFSMRG